MEMIDNRYKILFQLYESIDNRVYTVNDLLGNHNLALKLTRIRNKKDVGKEFLLLNRLRNPHIVRAYDFGFNGDNFYYMTMDYISGYKVLDYPLVNVDSFERIFNQLCTSLSFIHQRNIIHADLSSQNVLIQKDDEGKPFVKLIDFNLSGQPGRGHACGTRGYIAPEVLMGGKPSICSDLYALGVLLYEICSGKKLFSSELSSEEIRFHLEEPVPDTEFKMNELPTEFSGILEKLLAKEPFNRYASASDVLAEGKDIFRNLRKTAIFFNPYPGIFLGRRKELGILKKSFERKRKNRYH
jgi:serine/threonine-protein kinase